MTSLYYPPKFESGRAGAKLTFSLTGTSTLQNTYSDAALTTPNTNPVIADSNGVFAPIYLDPTLPNYRVLYTTSADVLVYQVDNVPSNQGVQQSIRLQSTDPNVFLYDTDGTVNARKYRVRASGASFQVQASNDAESVFTTILEFTGGVLTIGGVAAAAVIGGNAVSTNTATATFTGTLTGMTGATSSTFTYFRTGNIAVIRQTSNLTGTSNSTSMTLTGIPAAIQPTVDNTVLCGRICDNGNHNLLGEASVSSGTMTFGIVKSNTVANFNQTLTTGFTNSGTKGLSAGWYAIYPLI